MRCEVLASGSLTVGGRLCECDSLKKATLQCVHTRRNDTCWWRTPGGTVRARVSGRAKRMRELWAYKWRCVCVLPTHPTTLLPWSLLAECTNTAQSQPDWDARRECTQVKAHTRGIWWGGVNVCRRGWLMGRGCDTGYAYTPAREGPDRSAGATLTQCSVIHSSARSDRLVGGCWKATFDPAFSRCGQSDCMVRSVCL